jgi:hypothetical protein
MTFEGVYYLTLCGIVWYRVLDVSRQHESECHFAKARALLVLRLRESFLLAESLFQKLTCSNPLSVFGPRGPTNPDLRPLVQSDWSLETRGRVWIAERNTFQEKNILVQSDELI